ncbi:MAG: hypothetical protein H6712_26860 [Myxococcales bacterium]|nr:hypothetical protein [Myxococcales bacterium]MCB9717497.1 hypothetical protein [Myxococcales bacterium]
MAKLIVINVGTEHALGLDWSSAHPIARSVWRSAWLAEEGDVLVSPVPFDPGFLEYVGHTLGIDMGTVGVVTRSRPLTDDELRSPGLVAELRAHVERGAITSSTSCFSTEGTAELALALGLAPAEHRFAAEGGGVLLNRKTHFRQLAAGLGLPLAPGRTVHSPSALAAAVRELLVHTGTVILKKDDGAGGMGNVTITTEEPGPLPGSSQTRHVDEGIDALASELYPRLGEPAGGGLVVEAYFRAAHMFYLEYRVGADGRPRFLDSGTIRLRPDRDPDAPALVWVGLDIPAEVPSYSLCRALGHATELVLLAARLGYRGHVNVDAIVTDAGQLVFNEINGRWGGGLVLHAIASRLLGEGHADVCCLSSLREVDSPPRREALRILEREGLHFDPRSREGAIVVSCDEARSGTMECMVIGPSRARARQLEDRLRAALGRPEIARVRSRAIS